MQILYLKKIRRRNGIKLLLTAVYKRIVIFY